MTQQATTTIQQAANGGQVATQRKPVDILKVSSINSIYPLVSDSRTL